MSTKALVAPVLAGALFACVGAAATEPGPAYWLYEGSATAPRAQGQFFAGFKFNASVQHVPRFNSTASLFITQGLTFVPIVATAFEKNALAYSPGGEIGYVLRDGTLPAWAGSNVRISVFGSVTFADRRASQTTPTPSNFSFFGFNVDGSLINGNFGGFVGTYNESLRIQREQFELGLKLESDVALAPNLSLTPAIAFFSGRAFDKYTYDARVVLPGTPLTGGLARLNESLRTWEFGGSLGARLTWSFRPGWALDFGGSAGFVALSSRLRADSCVAQIALASVECGPGAVLVSTAKLTGSEYAMGFRGTASLGLTTDLRYAILSLGGFMRYDSHIPGIENPQFSQATTAFTNLPHPTRIVYAGGFAYGGHVRLRIPIH
jgi:hypothetical protein